MNSCCCGGGNRDDGFDEDDDLRMILGFNLCITLSMILMIERGQSKEKLFVKQ